MSERYSDSWFDYPVDEARMRRVGHWPLPWGAEAGTGFRWEGNNCQLVEVIDHSPYSKTHVYKYWDGSKTVIGHKKLDIYT